jgi:hypothetical protein
MHEDILQLKKRASDHDLLILNSELKKHKKSTAFAYLLWLLLGYLGMHKFYLGKAKEGVLYMILAIGGCLALYTEMLFPSIPFAFADQLSDKLAQPLGAGMVAFAICSAGLAAFLLYDLFTIPGQMRKSYELHERQILMKLRIASVGVDISQEVSY